jgi:hypothetical protein
MEMSKGNNPLKCVADIRGIPPSAYKLPSDGRKEKHLCRLRWQLAWFLATYANPDGTSIRPSRASMAVALGVHIRTISRLLVDLKTLEFLSDDGWFAIGETHLRKRTLNIAKIQQAAGASTVPDTQASTVPDTPSTVPNSEPLCQIGPSTVPNSFGTQPPFLDRPTKPPTQPSTGVRVNNSFEAWLDKEAQAADTLEEVLRHVPEDMLGSDWKNGEQQQARKLIAEHGWEKAVAVVKKYWQQKDPATFEKTIFKWTGLLPSFAAWAEKVTPEMLRAQAWDRWLSNPANAAAVNEHCAQQYAAGRAADAAQWDAMSATGAAKATVSEMTIEQFFEEFPDAKP